MALKRCPHCKSKRGFSINVSLGGYQTTQLDFNGKVLDIKREPTDQVDKFAACLDCNKSIDAEELNTENA